MTVRYKIIQTRTTVERLTYIVEANSEQEAANAVLVAADANDREICDERSTYEVEPDLTEAQAARIAEYRKTFKFAQEPKLQLDRTVCFVIIASNNANQTVHVLVGVQPDGTTRHESTYQPR